MLQGLAHFPGVNQIVDASFSFTHGISPSIATVSAAPQPGFSADVGPLVFTFGSVVVTFPGCKLDYHSLQWDERGQVWRMQILDRRWSWKWGKIAGHYNVYADDATVQGKGLDDSTEKSPRELAKLCLEEMGESRYSLGDLPDEPRPEIHWDGIPPAEALADLCDQLGCRVVLGLDNRVSLRRVGAGGQLPTDGVMEDSENLDRPEMPDSIGVLCGPDRVQIDFELEAVGLETASTRVPEEERSTIKPIADLSYKPSEGWNIYRSPWFQPPAVTTSKEDRELAARCVYRWYRIKCPPPGLPDYADIKQVLPLEDVQVETTTEENRIVSQPAVVYGCWYPNWGDYDRTTEANVIGSIDPNGTTDQRYNRPWTLDTQRGIVQFSVQTYKNTESGSPPRKLTVGEADIRLRVACVLKDKDTRAATRYERVRKTGVRLGTPTRWLRHDELTRNWVPEYGGSNFNVKSWAENSADLNVQCDHYLDAAMAEYRNEFPTTRKYAGLRPIPLDGAIQQVTFVVGPRGCTTTASRNTEQLDRVFPYRFRRSQEKQRATSRMEAMFNRHFARDAEIAQALRKRHGAI
jgi:hypothetical protein